MNAKIKAHFINLSKALQAEKLEEVNQYKSLMNHANFSKRIEEGITLYPIEFVKLYFNDFGDQLIEVKTNPNQEGTAFKSGKTIEIFNSEGKQTEGQVSSFRENSLIMKTADENIEDWIKKGKVGLNSLIDTKTYDAYSKALKKIIDSEKTGIPDLFYLNDTSYKIADDFSSQSLNSSQNNAVNEILSERPLSIIHGPPGTGKTSTLVAAISKITALKKSIIVCAPSNAAVDHISTKLLQNKINVVRIGNEIKVDEKVKDAYLNNKIKQDRSYKFLQQLKTQSEDIRKKAFKYKRNFGKEEYNERKKLKQELKLIRSDIRKIQQDISKNVLEKASVVCGTFYSIQQFNLPKNKYDYLIIDEAGQAIEPAIWSIAHLSDKIVLAGDDLQLPPTVKSKQAEKMGLAKSLVEKATEINYPRTLLNIQYRMNEKIMAFSNQQFYNNQLIADTTVSNWTIDGNQYEAVEFIDTAGCGHNEIKEDNGGGIYNPGEALVLHNIIKEYNDPSIAIITPYRRQLNEIQSVMSKTDSNTIDSFQGQERNIILISLCRSNENGEIGFLKDKRRMNVAMTRAKKKLVVIGDSATIGQNQFYNDFLEFVEKNGSYRTAWEFE